MSGPKFFVDRSLGRKRVPTLLRDDGWQLITLAEHYGIPEDESIADVDWLNLAGDQHWPVLMKDERIRYRSAERQALVTRGVRAFCLTSGNLSAPDMATAFIRHRDTIWLESLGDGPALFAVSATALRLIDLSRSNEEE